VTAEPYLDYCTSPLGLVQIEANDRGITAIKFVESEPTQLRTAKLTTQAKTQLVEYFAGERTQFDLPLAARGTDFQNRVWHALMSVQYAQVASYSDIANAIGNPKAVRAVGAANGKNPIAIVVPCHRIIGKNGTLTGYAGGLDKKQHLLALEQKRP